MVWKSNITARSLEKDVTMEELSSPKLMENKENRDNAVKDSSITIDARTSENYLQDDDVIEV